MAHGRRIDQLWQTVRDEGEGKDLFRSQSLLQALELVPRVWGTVEAGTKAISSSRVEVYASIAGVLPLRPPSEPQPPSPTGESKLIIGHEPKLDLTHCIDVWSSHGCAMVRERGSRH